MSGGMPELGSRISLISKADIRYEGRLFTVDPQECTIALAGVQSFGTEERETACPIAPQSQIYEYILFRGSDIKDIRVINNCTIPNDPAIMQMHLPSQTPLLQSPYHTAGFNVSNPMSHGAVPSQVNTYNQMNPHSAFGKLGSSQNLVGELTGKPMKPYDMLENSEMTMDPKGLSRSTSPIVSNPRRSPVAESSVQVPKPGNKMNSHVNQRSDSHHQRNEMGGDMQQRMNRGGNRNFDGNNQNRPWNNNRNNMNNNSRNRYRGRPQMGQGSFNAPMRGQGNRGRNVLKFENDYDFEQANNKFEELRSQLSKIKINEENKVQKANGEPEKKEDSGNETGTGEIEHEDDEIGYDKTKSFFDNISCEAIERSKGKTKRTDWRQEKKLNTETFGVSSNRRSNFRSRGGFNRNYNRNANFRDDFRGRTGGNRSNQGGFVPRNPETATKNP